MTVFRGSIVETRENLLCEGQVNVPKGTILKVDSADFEGDAEMFTLVGLVNINGSKRKINVKAYNNDFIKKKDI